MTDRDSPECADGSKIETIVFSRSSLVPDVEICLYGLVYHLHSALLRVSSEFFDRSLSPDWWKEEYTIADGGSIKYRYILSREESGDIPMLLPAKADTVDPPSEMDADGGEANILRAYASMFRLIYGKNPHLNTAHSWVKPLQKLVEVADLYGCFHSISRPLESEMLRDEELLEDLVKNPAPYSDIALIMESEVLYKESFIHLVGRWHVHRHANEALDDRTRQRVNDEYMRLLEAKMQATEWILRKITKNSTVGSALEALWKILVDPPEDGRGLDITLFKRMASFRWDQNKHEAEYRRTLHLAPTPGTVNAFLRDLETHYSQFLGYSGSMSFIKRQNDIPYMVCAVLDSYPWEE